MINFVGPVNDLSYGIVVKNIVEQFPDSALLPIGGLSGDYNSIKPNLDRGNHLSPKFKEFNPHNPSIRIWHAHDMSIFTGKERIGWPIFELETFTEQEKNHLNSLDGVIVCSQWAKQVIVNETKFSDASVVVVPLGVSPAFNPVSSPKKDKVIFLNIGKWEVRKGHDILHKIFSQAFQDVDDVELWMMPDNPFYDCTHWYDEYRKVLREKVKFIPRQPTHESVAKIIGMADVFAAPSRAEGWCMPLMESMSMGKQVVCTYCTAMTEYCNEDNAILIQPTGKVKANDGIWFKHGEWYNFSESDFIDGLKIAYNRIKEGKINEQGIATGRRFTWGNSGRIIRERICGNQN